MNEEETPSTAADMRALADQAEAEAAEAEALAAAARARARALQLRRQAEHSEAEKEAAATQDPVEEAPEDETADAVETQAAEAEETESAGAETDESPAEEVAEVLEPGRRLVGRIRQLKWTTVAAALAVAVILGALAGSGYVIKEHRDAVRENQREAEFAAAARRGVLTLTSLDFNDAKQGVQRIADNSTGSFRDDFQKMAADFTKVVAQSKVVSQGSVAAAAVELGSMTNDSAVVLVASTSTITNAAGAKQEPRNYRLIVTVTRDGGQLKISKVEFVP